MENDIKFEKALGELEKIVDELESGKLALDEALKRYEEGVKLSRACTKKLNEAEKKIEILTDALSQAANVDIDLEEEGAKKGKKAKKSKADEGDDFLL